LLSSCGAFRNRVKLAARQKQATGDTLNISEWLRGLDLAQYEPIFRDNAIDLQIEKRAVGDEVGGRFESAGWSILICG
jgi:hypothetical protein